MTNPAISATVPQISTTTAQGGLFSYPAAFFSKMTSFLFSLVSTEQNPAQIGNYSVMEITSGGWSTIAKTAQEWKKLADEKYRTIHGGKTPQWVLREQAVKDPGILVKNSSNVLDCIQHCLTDPSQAQTEGTEPWNTVLVSKDGSGKIQALALWDKKENKLAYLATHPDNLRHPINDNGVSRAQGAGTAVIVYIASKLNKTLYLRANEPSKKFYEKCGFENDSFHYQSSDSYYGIVAMVLTKEKVQQLIKEKTHPFNVL